MRISDWSSDVCSSDLAFAPPPGRRPSETRGPCVRRSPARRSNLLDLAVRSATGRTVRETLPLLSSPSSNPLARLGERLSYPVPQIGRAHVRTPVTNAHLVCRLLLEKKNKNTIPYLQHK